MDFDFGYGFDRSLMEAFFEWIEDWNVAIMINWLMDQISTFVSIRSDELMRF